MALRNCTRKQCKRDRVRLFELQSENEKLKKKLEEVNRSWMDERNRFEYLTQILPRQIMAEGIEKWLA
jgi:23S rRNA A2030 N6-methylase RlmJ